MTSPTKKERKLARHNAVKASRTYRLTQSIAKWMDRYYIDPIVGLLLPAYGDAVTALLNLPYLYISILKLHSIPLSLAIVYNMQEQVRAIFVLKRQLKIAVEKFKKNKI